MFRVRQFRVEMSPRLFTYRFVYQGELWLYRARVTASNCFERAYVDNFARIESKLGRNERVLDRWRKDISTMRNETYTMLRI